MHHRHPQSSKASPALAVLKGDLWAAFRGKNETTIYAAGLSDWGANKSIGQNSELAPAMAVFQDELQVAYVRKAGGDVELVSSKDGIHWSSPPQTTGLASKASPALAATNDNLWVAFQGSDDTIYVASAPNWQDKKSIGKSSHAAPALAVVNEHLWVAYIGEATGRVELISSTDGSHWPATSFDTGQASKFAPSLTTFAGELWVAYVGENSGHVELVHSKDGTNWPPNQKIDTGQSSQSAPSLGVVAAVLPPATLGGFGQYVFWGGATIPRRQSL